LQILAGNRQRPVEDAQRDIDILNSMGKIAESLLKIVGAQ
jgi:hypothetical protein